jgi:hypothetical protein
MKLLLFLGSEDDQLLVVVEVVGKESFLFSVYDVPVAHVASEAGDHGSVVCEIHLNQSIRAVFSVGTDSLNCSCSFFAAAPEGFIFAIY